jgi:hypothetical protein
LIYKERPAIDDARVPGLPEDEVLKDMYDMGVCRCLQFALCLSLNSGYTSFEATPLTRVALNLLIIPRRLPTLARRRMAITTSCHKHMQGLLVILIHRLLFQSTDRIPRLHLFLPRPRHVIRPFNLIGNFLPRLLRPNRSTLLRNRSHDIGVRIDRTRQRRRLITSRRLPRPQRPDLLWTMSWRVRRASSRRRGQIRPRHRLLLLPL